MPSLLTEQLKTYRAEPRGGMNLLAAQIEPMWEHPLDLVNCVPRPDGYTGGPGWAIVGSEIVTADGVLCHLTGFTRSDESNDTVAVSTERVYKLSGGAWSSIQDGTDLTLASGDHPTSVWFNDLLYFGFPKSAAANAPRKWTGTGNISTVASAMFNARWLELFGNRLVSGGVWNASNVYLPYDVYRSADGAPATHNAEFTRFSQSSSSLMRILRLGQQLMCYKQNGIGVLHISGGENADIDPFEPDEIPRNIGLALSEAVCAGNNAHFFLGNDDIYLMRGGEFPKPIGNGIAPLLYDALAAGSFVLAAYDNRSPQLDGFYLLTNVAVAAGHKAIGPNSSATTYTYFYYDLATETWSRGELTNVPRAVGNYFTRFGFLDQAPISQSAMMMALDSTLGSSAYALDYATTTRVGAAFTPRILWPIADFGEPFHHKHISDCWPLLKRRSSGTCTISWKVANTINEVPTERASLTFNMDGTSGPRIANVTGRFVQPEITFSTNDFHFQGIGYRARMRQ